MTARVAREDSAAGGLTVRLSCPVGDEVTCLQVAGEVDLANLGILREHLEEQVTAGRRGVVLDLTEVHFFAACGAGLLAETTERADALGVALRVVTDAGPVLRVLELTGLNGVIRRARSVAEAVEDCST
ncbi:MAG: STAS domain-containing protein [Actinomycetota bacterium]|nr:STAS domain-containing protein [Actinomycetota bacterium]